MLTSSGNESEPELQSFDSSSVDSKLNMLEEKVIMSIFLTVIILGFFGNILVIWTVMINKHMRTSNNLFILNLAISDLTLCIFSIPFNVYKVLRHTWIFGEFLCKFAPFFQATNVFVSTMSITAIALDRYISIVCAMRIRQSGNIFSSYGSIACLIFIWAFAFLLSSPLFLFNIHKGISLNFDSSIDGLSAVESVDEIGLSVAKQPGDSNSSSNLQTPVKYDSFVIDDEMMQHINVAHCIENSPFHQSRLIYSYVSLIIQYLLPILIVGVAYCSIWWKLKKQRDKLKSHQHPNNHPANQRNQRDGETKSHAAAPANGANTAADHHDIHRKNTVKSRRLKMNILLAFIAIIFAASWLPLNIFNILSDYNLGMIRVGHSYYLVNAVCILFAMSSAVSNPFLYGFLNENFKREYVTLFRNFYGKMKSCCPSTSGTGSNNTRPTSNRANISSNNKTTVAKSVVQPGVKNVREAEALLRQKQQPEIVINDECQPAIEENV